MSEEIKLLMAMCEALGLKVERIADCRERKEPQQFAMLYKGLSTSSDRQLRNTGGMFDIDNEGFYTSYLVNPEISYKVTKEIEE
tara:strand:- start:280 stop:531 length:252 start_codon:yes stop_codon:yes gene_type:complete